MSGSNDLNNGKSIQQNLRKWLKQGGYNLRKSLLDNIPEDERAVTIKKITDGTEAVAVLGIKFNPPLDNFTFKVLLPPALKFTKSQLLFEASPVFDPINLISPDFRNQNSTQKIPAN